MKFIRRGDEQIKFNKSSIEVELTDGATFSLYLEESLPDFEDADEYADADWDELPDIDFDGGYWSILLRDNQLLVISITIYGEQVKEWTVGDQDTEYVMPLKVDVLWQLDAYNKAKEFAVWYNDNVAPFDPQIIEDALIEWCSR